MFPNYIFDFGQVLFHFTPGKMVSDFVEDREDAAIIEKALFDRLYWDRLDLGTISDEEVKDLACRRLPQRLHDVTRKVYDHWFRGDLLIKGMPDVLDQLKARGAGIYLLSNISCGFAENCQSVPHLARLFSKFDGLVFSGPLHIVKPDPAIFQYLLSKYRLNAGECFFIDDSQKNLDGAAQVGIQGYRFDGDVKRLREFLFD